MPATLASNALTTLSAVRGDLKIAASNTADDDLIIRYINAASEAIERYCGRRFARVADHEETLAPNCTPRILLDLTPVLSVASITSDGEALDAESYGIENAEAGIVYRECGWPIVSAWRQGVSQDIAPGTIKASLIITYTGGYVLPQAATDEDPQTLPADLEEACVALVVNRYRNRGQVKDGVQQLSGFDLSSVEAILLRYKRLI